MFIAHGASMPAGAAPWMEGVVAPRELTGSAAPSYKEIP